MFFNILNIILSFVAPKNDAGTFRFGLRHTATAASILGCFLIKMNSLYYTRLEAIQNNLSNATELTQIKKDSMETKLFAYTQLQRVDDRWDEIKFRLDGLESHLKRIEKVKNSDALSANLNHNIENKD